MMRFLHIYSYTIYCPLHFFYSQSTMCALISNDSKYFAPGVGTRSQNCHWDAWPYFSDILTRFESPCLCSLTLAITVAVADTLVTILLAVTALMSPSPSLFLIFALAMSSHSHSLTLAVTVTRGCPRVAVTHPPCSAGTL